MRKVIFGGANSLDNYLARKDDAVDWLLWSNDVSKFLADYFKRFDTVVMGRKTYLAGLKMGTDGSPGVKNYVFSRKLKQKPNSNVEIISEDAADFVGKLKQQPGKDICVMGGGILAKSLLEADLIDEIGFNIHPVLLGSGVPLFYEMKKQINLELTDCRKFSTGCVLVIYRVKHNAPRSKGKKGKLASLENASKKNIRVRRNANKR